MPSKKAARPCDLQRALATALALGDVTGLAVCTQPALRERSFGRLEGLSYAEVDARFPIDALHWRQRDLRFAPGGGEMLPEFQQRCVPLVAQLAAGHPGQAIAVVAHGGVLDCLYRAAAGIAPSIS